MKNYIIAGLILIAILSVASIYQTISIANLKTELAEKKVVYIANLKLKEIEKAENETKEAIILAKKAIRITENLIKNYGN